MMIVILGACGGSDKESNGGIEAETNTSEVVANIDDDSNAENSSAENDMDDQRKAEPRQVPTEFPLPKLAGWVEGHPFEETKTGKKEGWSAEFLFEDAIENNAAQYEELLLEHGYQVDGHAFVEMSLGKGYVASGHISGIFYSGTIVFDTNADGQSRVWFNFTEKSEE